MTADALKNKLNSELVSAHAESPCFTHSQLTTTTLVNEVATTIQRDQSERRIPRISPSP